MKNHLKAFLAFVAILSISTQAVAAEMKEWSFLVFLNGNNNLDSYGAMNINQMEEVGSTDKLNILVQWGSMAKNGVDRLYVQKDNDKKKVTSPVAQSLGNVDMGDYRSLVDFVRWAKENYPAKRYFISVWNHGSGWHRPENFVPSDISWDDKTGSKITTEQLGIAMKESAQIIGHKVDLYGSDACLMAMVEVAAEMQDSVEVFAGSQDLEPGEGWPYNTFLTKWAAQPEMSAADVGKLLSREFTAAYSGGIYGRQSVTFSIFDMTKYAPYRAAISRLGNELRNLPTDSMKKVLQSASSSKYFYNDDYKDAMDFLNRVERNIPISRAANDLRQAHSNFVIANDQNQDKVTHGLSIWLPDTRYSMNAYWPRYQNLQFHKETGWGDFLKTMNK